MAQFGTLHTYNGGARSADSLSRCLESAGLSSLAVPAFLSIDMLDTREGMKDEICWRRAGVRTGIGSYGENVPLVT